MKKVFFLALFVVAAFFCADKVSAQVVFPPTVSYFNPADNATGVGVNANFEIGFSKTIATSTGNIVLYKTSDNSVVETIDIASSKVTASGTTALIINPSVILAGQTEYYFTIASTTVDDLGGYSYAGITASTTWSFTTEIFDVGFTSPPTPLNNTATSSTSVGVKVNTSNNSQHYVLNNLDSSILGWWRGEGNTNDDSGNSATGTWSGTPAYSNSTSTPTEKFGHAFSFDGSSSIAISKPSSPVFTFSTWLNNTDGNLLWNRIVSNKVAYTDNNGWEISLATGVNTTVYVGGSSSQWAGGGISCSGITSGWHHLVAVYNGNTATVYCDGLLAGSGAIAPVTSNANTLFLGRMPPGGLGYEFWQGLLDEAIIFNRILSATEVEALYNAATDRYDETVAGLSAGNHTIKAYAIYPNGQATSTELRTFSVDTTNPILSYFNPADNATSVGVNSNFEIGFNEAIATSTGNIVLYKTSDNSVVETINITSSRVTASGTTALIINPSVTLEGQTEYYFTIASTTVDDLVGNSYAGITASTTWGFTTADIALPVISGASPSGEQALGTTSVTLTLTTNEDATCKYSQSSGTVFSSMTTFLTTGTSTHSSIIPGLSNGTRYNYYVVCQDGSGNESLETTISFSVANSVGGGGLPSEAYNKPAVPTGGFWMKINSGASKTPSPQVSLSFNAGDNVANVAVSNSPDFKNSGQELYTSTKDWNFCWENSLIKTPVTCSPGKYTVYAKFYTRWGQQSEAVSAIVDYTGQSNTGLGNISISGNFLKKFLQKGNTGKEVIVLQTFLAKDPEVYPEGLVTGFFGKLTSQAVQRFQIKYNIANQKHLAYGMVGPATRAKLNQLFAQ